MQFLLYGLSNLLIGGEFTISLWICKLFDMEIAFTLKLFKRFLRFAVLPCRAEVLSLHCQGQGNRVRIPGSPAAVSPAVKAFSTLLCHWPGAGKAGKRRDKPEDLNLGEIVS